MGFVRHSEYLSSVGKTDKFLQVGILRLPRHEARAEVSL